MSDLFVVPNWASGGDLWYRLCVRADNVTLEQLFVPPTDVWSQMKNFSRSDCSSWSFQLYSAASITRPLTSPLWRRAKYSMGKPYMRVTILAAIATVRRVCNCSTPLRCIQITGPSKTPNAPIPSKNDTAASGHALPKTGNKQNAAHDTNIA